MPRIVHIAIKVDDLEKATKFYEDVFGFRQTGTRYALGSAVAQETCESKAIGKDGKTACRCREDNLYKKVQD